MKIRLSLLFFLTAFSILAKEYSSEKLDKLWNEKKYYACYKQAVKEADRYKKEAAPLFYQALCLPYLQQHKKIIKKKKYSIFKVAELCSKMRARNPDGIHLKKYTDLLRQLQDTIFNQGKWRYEFFLNHEMNPDKWKTPEKELRVLDSKSNNCKKEAERLFNTLHKTFDNKNETWKSWYDQQHDYILEGYDFPEYNNPLYRFCNTGKNMNYLSDIEKQLFYFTNLARINPELFKNTYVKQYVPNPEGDYELSLNTDLSSMKPAPLLFPDQDLCRAAEHHALDMGKAGTTGHNSSDGTPCFERIRNIAGKGASGENCAYGPNRAFSILMLLLIDEGIPSKGHRYNQLGTTHYAGIAHRPHKSYGWNTVFDFR